MYVMSRKNLLSAMILNKAAELRFWWYLDGHAVRSVAAVTIDPEVKEWLRIRKQVRDANR